jgi:hypothetical protein
MPQRLQFSLEWLPKDAVQLPFVFLFRFESVCQLVRSVRLSEGQHLVTTGDSTRQAYAPTTRAGLGYWTPMLTAGVTWHLDEAKKWALSALSRYEFNTEQRDTDITPGQAWTLEWGASYALRPTIDLGVVGYYQVQTTKDSGSGSSDLKDWVWGVGPEINMVCPKLGLITSIRYVREIEAENRLQGNTVTVTLTKRF